MWGMPAFLQKSPEKMNASSSGAEDGERNSGDHEDHVDPVGTTSSKGLQQATSFLEVSALHIK